MIGNFGIRSHDGRSTVNTDLTTFCIGGTSTIRESIMKLESNRIGIVLAVDPEGRLTGTITDGDIRRAILSDISLDLPVSAISDMKGGSSFAEPVTAAEGTGRDALLGLLQEHNILHLPLVNEDGRVSGLVTLDEFVTPKAPSLQAVIMAGGAGSRLRPLTDDTPKPMLSVGDRPLMEIIIGQLRDAGIKRVDVAVYHRSEKITDHFGDGKPFGLDISYLTEDRPMGTAGALALMEAPQQTVLVMNGDILTQIDFRAMLAYHLENQADLTVAVQRYELQVPYGVIETEASSIRAISEKPMMKFLVNAGIYLLEPSVYPLIPLGTPSDMTDLIARLLDQGRPVAAFPIREYWLDIGRSADYQQAQQDVQTWTRSP